MMGFHETEGEMKLKCNYAVLVWGIQETPGNLAVFL